ncbi:MAG: phosphotransferase, partial [Candidatus Lokiarchaeota archaeon]
DKEIHQYFKEHESFLVDEQNPVFIHNDFQLTNIIGKEESGNIHINGIVDFDDWSIGVKSQDLVKLYFLTFNALKNPDILKSFLSGYKQYHTIDQLDNQIKFYTAFWLLRMINYQSYMKREAERNHSLKSPSDEIPYFLRELKKIITDQ